MDVRITVGDSSLWGDGLPISSAVLPDGRTQHAMKDGRRLTVPTTPTYVLEYLSNWGGVEPGETYPVNITIIGMSTVSGFYEAWNYDSGKVRSYRFDKTVTLTDAKDGTKFTGAELEGLLQKAPSAAGR